MSNLIVSISCSSCSGAIRLGEERCSGCGRSATSAELKALQRRWEAADPQAARNADRIHISRVILGAVAGLCTAWGLALWGVVDIEAAALQIVLGGVFTVLFVTSFRWALFATTCAAVIYLCAWSGEALVNPSMGAHFAHEKALTLGGLIAGCIAEVRLRHSKRVLRRQIKPPAKAG
jgi:hypothetical protein